MPFEEHASVARITWGSYFAIGRSITTPPVDPVSDTFDNVSEVTSGEPPDEQVDDVEVSHWGSPNRTKEYKAGMIDGGEVTITVNFNPEEIESHRRLVMLKKSAQVRNMRFVSTDGMETLDFPGYVKGLKRNMGGPGDPLTADVTIKVAGSVVSDRETT